MWCDWSAKGSAIKTSPQGFSSHRAPCKPISPTSTPNSASPPAYSSSKKPPATPNPLGAQAFPQGQTIGPLTTNGVASTSPKPRQTRGVTESRCASTVLTALDGLLVGT